MGTVVPLRSRDTSGFGLLLAAAVILGTVVAALCLDVVLGIGVEPAPDATGILLAVAALAFLPSAWVARRRSVLRRPAQLVVRPDGLTIAYPELLRAPLAVPRDQVRVARAGDVGGVYWGSYTPLPVLAPEDEPPNVVLLFEAPVRGARVRRSRLGGIYRGEGVAGVLVAAQDVRQADAALDPFIRQLTSYDEYLLEENLKAGGRFRREIPRVVLYTLIALMWIAWVVSWLVRGVLYLL
jgi:hypothetical protein